MINRIRNATTLALGRTYGDLIVLRVRMMAADGLNALLTKRVQLLEGRLAVSARECKRLEEERDSLAKGTRAGDADDLESDLGRALEELAGLRAKLANANGEIFNLKAELATVRSTLGTLERIGIAELARKALQARDGEPLLTACARVMHERGAAQDAVAGLERELRTAVASIDAITEERDRYALKAANA